ncbi:hypothetical protein VTN00DRAFT_295 [Thermoascus crustaceus]|uniref:uncharacterized protein n=1 Tax=Thermoascus crustaceus TaxID=5088 RepID=UPI003742F6B4
MRGPESDGAVSVVTGQCAAAVLIPLRLVLRIIMDRVLAMLPDNTVDIDWIQFATKMPPVQAVRPCLRRRDQRTPYLLRWVCESRIREATRREQRH